MRMIDESDRAELVRLRAQVAELEESLTEKAMQLNDWMLQDMKHQRRIAELEEDLRLQRAEQEAWAKHVAELEADRDEAERKAQVNLEDANRAWAIRADLLAALEHVQAGYVAWIERGGRLDEHIDSRIVSVALARAHQGEEGT